MLKKIIALVLVAVAAMAMLAGCDLMPKSVTMDKVNFSIGGKTYVLCESKLQDLVSGSKISCGSSAEFNEVKPGATQEIECSFQANGVTHDFSIIIWNNTDKKIKGAECVIKEVVIRNDGVHAIVPVSIMGVTLNDTYESFEQYFGKCEKITKNHDGNVYTWENIPEKDGKYAITVVVCDAHNNSEVSTTTIIRLVTSLIR